MKRATYKVALWLTTPIERASTWADWVGCLVLAFMMFFTAADVIGRYLFNRPILGSYEIQAFLMTIVIGFALAICGVNKGHIVVDVILEFLPKRVRAFMDAVSFFISLVFMAVLVWETFSLMVTYFRTHNVATSIAIPSWPFALATALGLTLYALVLLRDLFYYFYQAAGGDAPLRKGAAE